MKHKVFVYGSLRQLCPLHGYLEGSLFLGEGKTKKEFTLFSLGPFPALVATGDTEVVGEVYMINDHTLRVLDMVEGHPDFYERTCVTLADGTEVFTYLLPGIPFGSREVKSGDWLDWITS